MNSEQAKAAAELMATVWEGEFPATCQVLAAVKNDNRNYKPDAKSRTAWELATHLATADIWFIDSILNGAFEWNPDAAKQAESQFKSVDDVVEFYKKTFPEKLKPLRAMPARQAHADASASSACSTGRRCSSSASPTTTASITAVSSPRICARWARRCRTSTARARDDKEG